MVKDYYSVLGVKRTATDAEIKDAYRRLSFECHPDRYKNDPAKEIEMEGRFKEVGEAFAVLSDPDRRARYDRGQLDPDEVARILAALHDEYKAARDAVKNRHWLQAARSGLRLALGGLDAIAKPFGEK